MKTAHKFTLDEAKEILRKEYNIKAEDEVEIETLKPFPSLYVGGSATTLPNCSYTAEHIGIPC